MGAMLGQRPDQTLKQTLPELCLALRGWQRANGVDPDKEDHSQPMSHQRLMELAERIDADGHECRGR